MSGPGKSCRAAQRHRTGAQLIGGESLPHAEPAPRRCRDRGRRSQCCRAMGAACASCKRSRHPGSPEPRPLGRYVASACGGPQHRVCRKTQDLAAPIVRACCGTDRPKQRWCSAALQSAARSDRARSTRARSGRRTAFCSTSRERSPPEALLRRLSRCDRCRNENFACEGGC